MILPAINSAGERELSKNEFDIVDTTLAAGHLSALAAALGASGLIKTLRSTGPFTVFAPTDEAFAKLPPQFVTDLLKPVNKSKLAGIVSYHVLPGKWTAREILSRDAEGATTLQGQRLKIGSAGGLMIDGARVLISDVETSNGVIHIIDTVLLPASATVAR